jgi:hypothetical protein
MDRFAAASLSVEPLLNLKRQVLPAPLSFNIDTTGLTALITPAIPAVAELSSAAVYAWFAVRVESK